MLNINGKILDKLDANEYYLFSILLNYGKKSHPDNGVLMHRTGWGLQKLQKVKKSLVDKEIIEINARFDREDNARGRASNEYKIKCRGCSKFNGVQLYDFHVIEIQLDENHVHEIQLDDFQVENKVLKLSIIETIKLLKEENKEKEEKPLNFIEEVREILNFFVHTTGKSLRIGKTDSLLARSDKYKKILPRLRDGATVQECKAVIAIKTKQWKGDKKMDSSLCIPTLFRASNFEKYLDECDNSSEQITDTSNYTPPYHVPEFETEDAKQKFFYVRYHSYKSTGKLDEYKINTTYRQRALLDRQAQALCYELEQENPFFANMEIKQPNR